MTQLIVYLTQDGQGRWYRRHLTGNLAAPAIPMRPRFEENADLEEPHVMLSTDGEGRWWRREWQRQCSFRMMFSDRCQGVAGHEGHHWCYRSDGSYEWESERDDLQPHDIAGGTTPPDHHSYVGPLEKAEEYHVGHYTDSEVTDPDEIARLERGEMRDGESINRPVPREEWEALGLDPNEWRGDPSDDDPKIAKEGL